MKLGKTLTLLSLILLNVACGGGGGGGSSAPVAPAPNPEPTPSGFDYRFEGTIIKGAISGASVSVIDADGNPVGTAAVSGNNGIYRVSFNSSEELALPLLISVDGSDASTICDLRPTCNIGLGSDGNPAIVAFGEPYPLPDGFELRAAIENFATIGDGTIVGSAFVSPLSEFVVAAALSRGNGTLTTNNLDVANERVASILADIYPQLPIPAGLQIASVPLIDITETENADLSNTNELSLVISSVSAALLDFVEPGNSSQSDITAVLDSFSTRINNALDQTGSLLGNQTSALLANAAVTSLAQTVEELATLQDSGSVTLPNDLAITDLNELVTSAEEALPEIITIRTSLTASESLTPSMSSAFGLADLSYLPESGEATVSLKTTGTSVTAAHFHLGFAGENGGILVELEQDIQNPNYWQFPDGTILDDETLQAMAMGQTYFSVQSAAYPDGELRGQVLPSGVSAYFVTLSGMQQMPVPVSSNRFARAAITLNTATSLVQAHLSAGEQGITTAHIHEGIAGANGPVVIELIPDTLTDNHWFAANLELSGEMRNKLEEGRLYFNIHTAEYPSGEIRGQILSSVFDLRISSLDPSQVVSNNTVISSGSGVSAVTTNLTTGQFTAHINLNQLDVPLAVSISEAEPGENGNLLFELSQDPLFEFIPQAAGVSHWFIEKQTLSAQQLAQYLQGGFYVQAYSAAYPDGELRGQLTAGETDSDGDGVPDGLDDFPQDASESRDTDGDGIGDNSDAFPHNPDETDDTDGDGTGDNADDCPTDASGIIDSDDDGICDDTDLSDTEDSDNDGVVDSDDAFPNDPTETMDTDGDGVGDNSDVFPGNGAESADSDADGVGDNADAFPFDATETLDSDGDGVGNNADAFPFDATETVDTDGDGIGDNADNCTVVFDPGNPDADADGLVSDCPDIASFAEVEEIFEANCIDCHGTDGGLTLSSGAYNNLVNVPSVAVPSIDLVEPGDSDMSYLIWTLEGRAGVVGTIQPPSGALSTEEIDLIKSWIDGGANP